MRIHSLQLVGIGPYKDPVEIDFDSFKNGKFLISGNTGSGKSMLIDAIYFALYGSVTGGSNLSEARLRSRLCGPKDPSSASVVFSTSSGIYRVTRTPHFWREKLRGDGLTEAKPQAQLFKLAQPDDPNNDALVTGVREVAFELARILPLTSDQFLQTIVLPQGHFEKFLMAPSDQRKAVLQTVFGTQIYQRFEAEVSRRAKDATEQSTRLWQDVEIAAGDLTQLPDVDPQARSIVRAHDLIVASTVNWYEACAQALTLAEAESYLRTTAKELETLYERENARNSLIEKRQNYLADYYEQATGFDAQACARYRLERDRQAASALAAAQALEDAQEKLETANRAVARDENNEVLELGNAQDRLSDAQNHLTLLEQFASRFRDLEKTRSQLLELTEEEEALTQEIKNTDAVIAKQLERIELLQAEVAGYETVDAEVEAAQAQLEKTKTEVHACQLYSDAQTQLEQIKQEVTHIEAELTAALANYAEIDAAWVADTAQLLAASLQPGDPCPVCGATEHPHPASSSTAASQAETTTAQLGETVSLSDRLSAARAVDYTRARYDAACNQAENAQAQLAALAVPAQTLAEAKTAQDDAAVSLSTAQERQQHLRSLLLKRVQEQEKLQQLREQSDIPKRNFQLVQQQRSQLEGKLEALEAGVQQQRDAQTKDILPENAAELADQLEQAREVFSRAQNDLASVHRLQASRTQVSQAQAHLQQALTTAGFSTLNAAVSAQLAKAQRVRLEETATFAKKTRQSLREHLLSPELRAVKTLSPTNLEPLHQKLGTLREQIHAGSMRLATMRTRAEVEATRRQRLSAAVAVWKQTQETNTVLLHLYDLVTNKYADSALGMPLSTWVLTQRLDEVLEVASPKLAHMSDGKFQFRRTSSDGSRRADQGLSVGIYVAEQDRVVAPGSLSGGETFMASLALALALIEVVQAEAGGVSISTMFIDEGFGTLDSAKLATVLQQLHDESERERTVGIISHVEELKRSIGDRIEVHSDEHGKSWVEVRA